MIGWSGKSREEVPRILDEGYLTRLSGHLGAEETRELLADGMLELADRLERLERLAAEGDTSGLSALTHDIAGAAGHLGLSALSWYAARANRDLREASTRDLARMIAPLTDCRAASIDALGRYCRQDGPNTPGDPG